MAFNGSGVWVRLYNWTNDAANGIKIRADRMDAEFNDMCNNGLSLVLTRDGQGSPSANIPMGGFKLTGLPVATALGDALSYGRAGNMTALALTAALTYGGVTLNNAVTGTGSMTLSQLISASAGSGATTGTIPLPAGGGTFVIGQNGPIGSGALAYVFHNQGGFVAIALTGTAISSGASNIASVQAVTGGFTITCNATGGTTNFTGTVIGAA